LLPSCPASLRGFLSIDIDVSGLYINQCDINNQFYSDGHNSNFRYSKFAPFNQPPQLFTHQIVPLQPSASVHPDNEIDALHDSHKCHRDSMDVCARCSLNIRRSQIDLIGFPLLPLLSLFLFSIMAHINNER
jgi:hypothetical protein